jgi:hypothetical protein
VTISNCLPERPDFWLKVAERVRASWTGVGSGRIKSTEQHACNPKTALDGVYCTLTALIMPMTV